MDGKVARAMRQQRRWHGLALAMSMVFGIGAFGSTPVDAAPTPSGLSADLAGIPIPLADVVLYHCDDFDAPRIHCFTTAAARDVSLGGLTSLAASGVAYVVIYDYASFSGASMYLSDDYSILAVIGWNDRISSFKGQNNQSGRFWTDWFGGGSPYNFCCNQQVAILGGWDNTFSSVNRT